jgi:hypothetical protein
VPALLAPSTALPLAAIIDMTMNLCLDGLSIIDDGALL